MSASDRPAAGARKLTPETVLPFLFLSAAAAAAIASLQPVLVASVSVGLVYQIVLAVRSRGRRLFAVRVVGAALLAGLLAATLAGPRAAVLLMPSGFAYLVLGLGLAQSDSVRSRAAAALRKRSLGTDDPGTAWSRDRAALALVIPICILALLLVPVATWSVHFGGSGDGGEPSDGSEPELDSAPSGADAAPRGTPRPAGGGPGSQGESGRRGLDPHGADARDVFAEKVHLEITPTREGQISANLGPLYLRGMQFVMAYGGRWRAEVANARRVADADDGSRDGWCDLSPRPAVAETVDFAIHQEGLHTASTGEAVVFAPPDTAAVEFPRVRVEPEGVVLTQAPAVTGSFDYRLAARLPSRVLFPGANTRLAGNAADKALPFDEPALADLSAMAWRAASVKRTDVGRVLAVVRHLRENYQFERIDERLADSGSLSEFLAAKSGTCFQFAQAGVVMLRSLGLPARLRTGLLVSDWDAKRHLYVADMRDFHAWVEVPFEGCGAVVFDPTPGAQMAQQADVDESGASGGPDLEKPPGFDLGSDEEPSEPLRLDEMIEAVRSLLARAADWIADHRWPALAVAAVLVALAGRSLRRRARRLAGEAVNAPAARGPWDRLLAELAHRGWRRHPSQTASEFARSVVAGGGAAYEPFLGLTARREAVRFGARPPLPSDEQEIEAFRSSFVKP